MKNTFKILVTILIILVNFSCTKESNNGKSESGIIRYKISIIEGYETFDITLNTNALDTKVIDIDTGAVVPENESIGGLIQTINESRISYDVESKEPTISMNLGLDFIEKEISSGKPVEIELQCFYNDKLEDTYSYAGAVGLVGQFTFLFTTDIGFKILGEPKK